MASIEQDLMAMLRQLPIPVTITWQNSRYHWQCAKGHGASPDLVEAVEQALRYLMVSLSTETTRVNGNGRELLIP